MLEYEAKLAGGTSDAVEQYVSVDQGHILSCHGGRVVLLLSASCEQMWTKTQPSAVTSSALDHASAVVGSDTGVVTCWRVDDGVEKWEVKHDDAVDAVCIHSGKVISCSSDFSARCWNAEDGEPQWKVMHEGPIGSIAMHTSAIFTGGNDAVVKSSAVLDGSEQWSSATHAGWIVFTCCMPDGMVISAGLDNSVKCVSAEQGAPVWDVQHAAGVVCLAAKFGAVISACKDRHLRCFSPQSGEEVWEFVAPADGAAVAISEDAVIHSCLDGFVCGLSLVSGKLLWSFSLSWPPTAIAFLTAGRFCLTGGGNLSVFQQPGIE